MARTNSSKKENRSAPTRRRRIIACIAMLVLLYFVYSIVSIQIEIYKERRTLETIVQRINETQLENDELARVAEGEGEDEYIERIAREKLGYAAADERVFEDVAGSNKTD